MFVTVQNQILLHLIKVLLPPKFAHLGSLQLHVLSTGSLSVSLDLALDRGVERSEHAGSEKGSVDAVVDADCCDGDAWIELVLFGVEMYLLGLVVVTYHEASAQCCTDYRHRRERYP